MKMKLYQREITAKALSRHPVFVTISSVDESATKLFFETVRRELVKRGWNDVSFSMVEFDVDIDADGHVKKKNEQNN